MSTGLTWVTIVDPASGSPDTQGSPVAFSLYDEAYAYGDWFIRYMYFSLGADAFAIRVTLYTSGPGQNGEFYNVAGVTSFIPFD